MELSDIKIRGCYVYRWSSQDCWHFKNYICEVLRITPKGRVTISYKFLARQGLGILEKKATVHPSRLSEITNESP